LHTEKSWNFNEIAANDYHFEYDENYDGEAVSLTMPTTQKKT
jgi:serine/threonine-protein kinase HipA